MINNTIWNRVRIVSAVIFLGSVSAHAQVWDAGGGVDTAFGQALNWDNNTVPSGSVTASMGLGGTVTYGAAEFHSIDNAEISGGTDLDMTGGSLNLNKSGNSIRFGVGVSSPGTVNQSGGTLQSGHILRIGDGTTGDYNLSGGALTVYRGGTSLMGNSANQSISIGPASGAGTLNITGGALTTRVGVEIGATGIFKVSGTGASQIGIGSNNNLDGTWVQHAGGTLCVGVDASGVTKIFIDEVDGDAGQSVTFESGSLLDVDHYNGATNGGTWTVMELENADIVDNGLIFAPGVDTAVWSFNIDNSGANGLLSVTASGETNSSTIVSSIAALRQVADDDNVTVSMTPGTYWMTGEADPLFLHFSGSNSTYNLTGVHIKVDTAELAGYGSSTDVNVINISGDDVVVEGLTLSMEKLANNGTDSYGFPREYTADKRSQVVKVVGSNVTVKDCIFTTGGSYPYGYGDAFGKGSRPNTDGVTDAAWISHKKQSGFLITDAAANIVVDNVTLNMKSYGHAFFMQGDSHDILFKDCSVIGDEMADSDDIIAHPEYQEWGFATYKEPIPADIRISKHESAFRTYNGISNVTMTNCLAERMRIGFAVRATGFVKIFDSELRECEQGFAANNLGETTILGCKGDAVNGPLIYFQYSVIEPATYEVELTGTTPGHGVWPVALINGDGSSVTLTSSALPGVYSQDAYVNVSQVWREWRHRPNGDIEDTTATTGTFITNLTDQILVFGERATENIGCISTGGVINKGTNNEYVGETLVPAPIIVQDTWTHPTNPTNVSWAQYSNGILILPTAPYTVFSGTLVVNNAESLGGSPVGDGGTTVSNGTLEIASGFALQGEDVVLSGSGMSGLGALYSEGSANNQTRLNSSSGSTALAGDTSIGVGVFGNQLLVGPIGGTGDLTKIGAGQLTMEGGANSFSGSLILAEGAIMARANKAVHDLVISAGANLSQNASVALNQGSSNTTTLDGTLDLNGRGVGDLNALSANVGSLTGGPSGLITSTSTAATQTVHINSATADSSFAGSVEGRVSLVKTGAGTTLALNGTCTHTEGTFVNAGWLGGTGTLSGDVTVAAGAGIAPGNSIGTLSTGSNVWSDGTLLDVEMDAGANDLLLVNGSLTLNGSTFLINLSAPDVGFNAQVEQSWKVVDATSISGFSANKFSVDASAFAENNPLEGGTFSVSESSGDLYVDFTPVPYTALEEWRFQEFGTYSNTGNAADSANPDNDARDNLLEYGTGSDPNVFDSNSVSTVRTTLDGSRMTITFDRITDPVLTYWVEAGTNLSSNDWNTIWSSTGSSNTAGSVTVEDSELISNHWNRYLQMKLMY